MINAISSSVSTPYPVGGTAELATLQKELVSYEKQLSVAQSGVVGGGPVQTQLLAAQVSLLTAQIVSLSGVTPVSFAQAGQVQAPSGLPAATGSNAGSAAPVATVTVAAVQQPVATAAPAPSPVSDQAALSQAQATLSAIFEKVSVQGATAPPAGPAPNSTVSTAAARAQTASQTSVSLPLASQLAANVPVGSNINVTV